MTIDLTPEQRCFVDEQLETEEYSDESEVVQRALEMLQRHSERIADARRGYQQGLDDVKAGRYREINSPRDAQALAEEIKKRGRELRVEREKATS